MEMTHEDILSSYRHAKDKDTQVRILAELNGASCFQIVNILQSMGEKVEYPGKRKHVKKEKPLNASMKIGRGSKLSSYTCLACQKSVYIAGDIRQCH